MLLTKDYIWFEHVISNKLKIVIVVAIKVTHGSLADDDWQSLRTCVIGFSKEKMQTPVTLQKNQSNPIKNYQKTCNSPKRKQIRTLGEDFQW